jgi:pimeloyl-ACP methyl ester carboxylesterase
MKKIIILHGWTYSLSKWKVFMRMMEKSGFDVEALEIPGLTKRSEKIWDLDKYSEWLGKQIGKSKPILLGHSNGGRIALYFSVKNATKVSKIILIDSAGIYHKEVSLQIKRYAFGVAAKIGKKLTKSEGIKKFLYKLAGEKDYKEASPNMKKSMLNLINSDLTPLLPKVKNSTLIIWGREDKVTPLSDGVLMNKFIKKSRLHVIAGARHSPFYTHPEEVIEIIKNDK